MKKVQTYSAIRMMSIFYSYSHVYVNYNTFYLFLSFEENSSLLKNVKSASLYFFHGSGTIFFFHSSAISEVSGIYCKIKERKCL